MTALADRIWWKCHCWTSEARLQKAICLTSLRMFSLESQPSCSLETQVALWRGPCGYVLINSTNFIMWVHHLGNGSSSPIWTALAVTKWKREKLCALSFTWLQIHEQNVWWLLHWTTKLWDGLLCSIKTETNCYTAQTKTFGVGFVIEWWKKSKGHE